MPDIVRCPVLIFRLDFTPYSSVSFVNFEHLNAGWVGYARHLPYTSNVSVLEKKGISLLKIEQLLCIPNLTRNFECHIQMLDFCVLRYLKIERNFPEIFSWVTGITINNEYNIVIFIFTFKFFKIFQLFELEKKLSKNFNIKVSCYYCNRYNFLEYPNNGTVKKSFSDRSAFSSLKGSGRVEFFFFEKIPS